MKRTWCIGVINARFIARMERLLQLYALPYDAAYPVVCCDERPCFLIGDIVEPIAVQTGKLAKEHYTYEKNGSCALLAAIEPLTGFRLAHVREQRTKKEFARFMQELADCFPKAKQIRVVLDNLNTHTASAFYEHLVAEEALALANRFEFYYTPKSASWLNMIEIEFSVLTRRCLNRRIATAAELEREVLSFFKVRSEQGVKIDWQFSLERARSSLNRHYRGVHAANGQYLKT